MSLLRNVAASALVATVAACSKVGPSVDDASGTSRVNSFTIPHVLRYADGEDIAGLNPHLVQQTPVSMMASLTMAFLVKFDRKNDPVPELLTVLPTRKNGGISADGKAITYHLRHDAKWSDGVPFTADDLVFSTRAVLNPANNEVSRSGWNLITKIDEPDKYTVVYHLSKVYAPFLITFFSTGGANPCLLPKHLLGSLPNINNAPYNALPVGIGPFKFAAWKRGEEVDMVPDPLYFRGLPKLHRIVYKIIPDRNTVLTQIQSGDIDMWAYAGIGYYERLKAVTAFDTVHQPGYYFRHIDFNLSHPALADVRVRRALLYAIDRRTILAKVDHGLGTLQDSPVSPISRSHDAKVGFTEFNLAKANALLDAAGWVRGPDGIRAKGGRRLVFDFALPSGQADVDERLELTRSTWKKAGVDFVTKHYAPSLLFAPYSEGGILYTGKFDLSTYAWGGDPFGDLSNLYACNQFPPNGQNSLHWCDPQADAAMRAYNVTYDAAERQPYADILQQRFASEVPSIVFFVEDDLFSWNKDLKGFSLSATAPFDDMMNVDI